MTGAKAPAPARPLKPFKEMVRDDIRDVFLDLDEFAEEHRIEGRTVTAVLDDDILRERQGGQELGVAESSLMLYAAVEDLPARRPAGEGLNIDGREYVINDWREDMGVAAIALGQSVVM